MGYVLYAHALDRQLHGLCNLQTACGDGHSAQQIRIIAFRVHVKDKRVAAYKHKETKTSYSPVEKGLYVSKYGVSLVAWVHTQHTNLYPLRTGNRSPQRARQRSHTAPDTYISQRAYCGARRTQSCWRQHPFVHTNNMLAPATNGIRASPTAEQSERVTSAGMATAWLQVVQIPAADSETRI